LVDDRRLIGGKHDLGPHIVWIDASALRGWHILVAGEWHGVGWPAAERRWLARMRALLLAVHVGDDPIEPPVDDRRLGPPLGGRLGRHRASRAALRAIFWTSRLDSGGAVRKALMRSSASRISGSVRPS